MTKRPCATSLLELNPPKEIMEQAHALEISGHEVTVEALHDPFCAVWEGKLFCDCSPDFHIKVTRDTGMH